MREIHIKLALNGFICQIGCQTVVFNTHIALLQELERYLENPKSVESEFIEKAVNKMHAALLEPATYQTNACEVPCNPVPQR